jgi:Ca2+-binding EF-hand superfamily protein
MQAYIEKVRTAEPKQEVEEEKKEETPAISQEEIDKQERIQGFIDEIWETFDKDNTGTLSRPETRNFVKEYFIKVGKGERFPEDQFVALFKEVDDNGDLIITKAEMKAFIKELDKEEVEKLTE